MTRPYITALAMLVSTIFAFGCASTTGPIGDGPSTQVPAEPWQLRAAARHGLTTMERSGIDLHAAGVLHGDDWVAYVDACDTARAILLSTASASIDPAEIAKAIAIARAAIKAGQSAWILANAAAIGEEAAAEWEIDGLAADAEFAAYVAIHPQ